MPHSDLYDPEINLYGKVVSLIVAAYFVGKPGCQVDAETMSRLKTS